MPDKWPLANGNWSNAANWNGGTKPVAGDDVYADGRTLNVDESFDVATLRNTQRSGGTIGGSFVFNTAGVTGSCTSLSFGANNLINVNLSSGVVNISVTTTILAATGITQHIVHGGTGDLIYNGGLQNGGAGTTNIVIFSKSGTGLTTINGSITSNGGNINAVTFSQNGTGSTIVNGNISVPSFAGATGAHAVSISNGTLSINGGVSGTSSVVTTTYAINQTGGTVVINGNVTAPTVNAAVWTINQTGGILNVNGNITGGGSNSAAHGINSSGGTSITVNGNVTGGSGATPGAAINTSAPATTLNINGNVTGGGAAGISYTTAGLLSVSGSCTAGSISPAVVSTNASATNIFTGPFINTNNTMAVQCVDMVLTQDASTFWNFGDITLYSPEQLAYYPSASDIRQGVTYADGTVSGSLAMPPPTAVIAGTPTDNTTGSAVLTPTQLQDAVWGRDLAQMTETGSIGYRLAKSATTDSTGNQIASYLI